MNAASSDWISKAQTLALSVHDFVAGRPVAGDGARAIEKRSPRDGRLLYRFNVASPVVVNAAVADANQAVDDGRWSKLSVQHRKDVLLRLAALMAEHGDELALLECLDVGKPIRDCLSIDIPTAISIIRASATGVEHVGGKVYAVDGTTMAYQLRRPIGVVAGIIGWNFPLVLAASKIGPALAAGNSLVLKPSEVTSLAACRIAKLAAEAGVPEGVFNVIHGDAEMGSMLARHPDVDMLTFTGSTQTGRQLMTASGVSNMKRLLLECGGKSPNIVFDDSICLDAVSESMVRRAFWNQGQVCTSSSRILVHEAIKDELLSVLIKKAAALKLGDPLKPETEFGAMVSEAHRDKVRRFIQGGEQEGARIAYQSHDQSPFERGSYVAPVIFDQVLPHQRIAQEEIFGPVLSVISFRDEAEAIRIANDTIYGLSAILWTRDLGRAHRIIYSMRAGSITVNATDHPGDGPGEGVISVGGHKQSGIGVEGGLQGLEAYQSQTAVQIYV